MWNPYKREENRYIPYFFQGITATIVTLGGMIQILLFYPLGPPAPLSTEFSCFWEMKYLLKRETHNKNKKNTLKELNKIFLMAYGLPK